MKAPMDSTEFVRRRYDRLAPFFDVMEGMMERMAFRHWRSLQWRRVEGGDILEVGVGTGKSFPFYAGDARITAIDFSRAMLQRA
ncbi:MAG: SAM-dependent methyltransferase, partial [Methylotetracoccus sp.]|nr:SAM-dependent methyltransferase [Methylotetracoccus sp.]